MPETRYARSGDVNIAYQVLGEGPFDLVLVHGFISHLDLDWDEPGMAHFLRRLASFSSSSASTSAEQVSPTARAGSRTSRRV